MDPRDSDRLRRLVGLPAVRMISELRARAAEVIGLLTEIRDLLVELRDRRREKV